MIHKNRKLRPGEEVHSELYNRLVDASYASQYVTCAPPLCVAMDAAGTHFWIDWSAVGAVTIGGDITFGDSFTSYTFVFNTNTTVNVFSNTFNFENLTVVNWLSGSSLIVAVGATFTVNALATFNAPVAFTCCIEYYPDVETLTTGTHNDFTPAACAPLIYVKTSGGNVTLTGMVPSAGCAYQLVTIKNVGPDHLILSCSDTGSAATHRFKLAPFLNYDNLTPSQVVLDVDESVTVWHDETVPASAYWDFLTINAGMKPRTAPLHSPGMVRDSGTSGANSDYWARDATWRAIPGASLTNAQSVSGDKLTFTTTGAWTDTDVTVTLPTAGTYLLTASVACYITSTVVGDAICARLFDSTNSAAVPGAGPATGATAQVASTQNIGTAAITALYTTTGTNVLVKIQVILAATGTASGHAGSLTSDVNGAVPVTTLDWVKVV